MNFQVSSVAEAEIAEALDYYEQQSPGLGVELLLEYEAAVRRIVTHLEAWRRIARNSRRCLLRRFPYGVVYENDGTRIALSNECDSSWYVELRSCAISGTTHLQVGVIRATMFRRGADHVALVARSDWSRLQS